MWFATHRYGISVFKLNIKLFLIIQFFKITILNAARKWTRFNKLVLILIILLVTIFFLIIPTIFSILSVHYSKDAIKEVFQNDKFLRFPCWYCQRWGIKIRWLLVASNVARVSTQTAVFIFP
jgi:hypothetical protein